MKGRRGETRARGAADAPGRCRQLRRDPLRGRERQAMGLPSPRRHDQVAAAVALGALDFRACRPKIRGSQLPQARLSGDDQGFRRRMLASGRVRALPSATRHPRQRNPNLSAARRAGVVEPRVAKRVRLTGKPSSGLEPETSSYHARSGASGRHGNTRRLAVSSASRGLGARGTHGQALAISQKQGRDRAGPSSLHRRQSEHEGSAGGARASDEQRASGRPFLPVAAAFGRGGREAGVVVSGDRRGGLLIRAGGRG